MAKSAQLPAGRNANLKKLLLLIARHVTIDLLMGEPSARNLIRSGGLRPTGTDAIVTARRTVTPSGGGTTTAARPSAPRCCATNASLRTGSR